MKAFFAALAALALMIALCVASDLYVAGICDRIDALLDESDPIQARRTWEQASVWVRPGCGGELCKSIDEAFSASGFDIRELRELIRELRDSAGISWDRII